MSVQGDITAQDDASEGASLARRIHLALREDILSLALPPGTRLNKAPICARFGVSRSPVAAALARLAAEGLADVSPRSASRVARLSMADLREATFLREAIELAAVERAATVATPAGLAALERNLEDQAALVAGGDHAGLFRADEAFHVLILSLTGFAGAAAAAEAVSAPLRRARMLLFPEPGRAEETVREHRAVIDALRARDPGAARAAMRTHLGQLIRRIEPLERSHPHLFRPAPCPSPEGDR